MVYGDDVITLLQDGLYKVIAGFTSTEEVIKLVEADDEVNAETNFEQTVYMLELPADNPEMLKTGLLVLHDWASAVTFDPEEIEKERGVVVE